MDNPQRLCTELLAPQLAAAYAAAVHSSCATYFSRMKSTSVQVRGVLQPGPHRRVKLHQMIERTNWAAVLQRHGASWWAIDLVWGRALR